MWIARKWTVQVWACYNICSVKLTTCLQCTPVEGLGSVNSLYTLEIQTAKVVWMNLIFVKILKSGCGQIENMFTPGMSFAVLYVLKFVGQQFPWETCFL